MWLIVGIAVVATYLGIWSQRHRVGLIHPEGNLRYYRFFNGGSTLDRIGYLLFWPLVRTDYLRQDMLLGARNEIHAHDRSAAGPVATGP